jgi:glutaryl-CoA dehydrogenase
LGAIGAAMDCYDTALRYAKERISLTNPIAGTIATKEISRNDYEITKHNC